jgi:putative hydrolase of the HAD superfamily
MRGRPLRKALRATKGAPPGLAKAVDEARASLNGNAQSYKVLFDALMSTRHVGLGDEEVVRAFLVNLHGELSKRVPVLWAKPPEQVAVPADVAALGRDLLLERLVRYVESHVNVVIRGAPGIGKTTLMEALRSRYPTAARTRLEQGAKPMRDLRLALNSYVNGDFATDDDVGIAQLASALPDPTILFVDNADASESARAVQRLAAHVPALVMVVTSRGQPFPGFRTEEVPPLERAAALDVVRDFDLTEEQIEVVLARGQGNPLMLLQEAWAATHQGDMDEDAGDRLEAVLRRFEGGGGRLLWLIGEMPTATLSHALLTEVGSMTPAGLDLLRRNAVAKPSAMGVEFHQTLRSACQDILAAVAPSRIADLRRNAASFYASWLRGEPSLEAVDVAFPNVLHLLERVDSAQLKVQLALGLIGDRLDDPVGYLPSRGLTALFREKRELLQNAAAEVGGVDAARLEKNLGLFCHWADDPAAQELVVSSRSRFRAAGDRLGEAAAVWVLGIIADDSGHYQDAELLYRAPLHWLHDPAARALGLHLVGCSLYHQGRYEEARDAFISARREATDPVVQSRSDRRMAYVELLGGDTERAIEHLLEIKTRAERLNRPRDVARTLRHIAIGRLKLGDLEHAADDFLAAREMFARIGDRRGLGATLLGLATTRRQQGHLEEARDLARQSKQIAGGGSAPTARMVSPLGVARAEEEEAEVAVAEARDADALRHRRRARNIYEAIGHGRAEALDAQLGSARDAPLPTRVRGVIFDLIDTLAHTDASLYEDVKRRMWESMGVEPEHFKAVWARSRRRASIDASWTSRDRIAWVADQLGVDMEPGRLEELGQMERELWTTNVRLKPGAREMLERLRANDFRLGLISNGTSAMRGLPERLGLKACVDACLVSCEVGILKPETPIYEHALAALDLRAAECVYVGDGSDRELEGAKAVGMFAVRMLAGPKPRYSSMNSLDWDATAYSLPELAEWLGV